MATTAEIIAQLTQQFAGGIGQGRAEVDQNGNPTGFIGFNVNGQPLTMQRQRVGNMADDGTQALGDFIGALQAGINPETGKAGAFMGRFGQDGKLAGIEWKDQPNKTDGLAGFLSQYGPMIVAALATAGATLGADVAGAGAAGGASGGAAGATSSAIPGAAGGGFQLPAGLSSSGVGTVANTSFMPGTFADFMANNIGSSLMGGTSALQSQMPTAAQGGSMQTAAPISASEPSTVNAAVAPQTGGILDFIKSNAGDLIGAGAGLLSAGSNNRQIRNMQEDVAGMQQAVSAIKPPEAPPVPGANNPEARGFQDGRNPILEVLGRNARANRNRTMLTGPGGVSMASVRVGGNSLLGM